MPDLRRKIETDPVFRNEPCVRTALRIGTDLASFWGESEDLDSNIPKHVLLLRNRICNGFDNWTTAFSDAHRVQITLSIFSYVSGGVTVKIELFKRGKIPFRTFEIFSSSSIGSIEK